MVFKYFVIKGCDVFKVCYLKKEFCAFEKKIKVNIYVTAASGSVIPNSMNKIFSFFFKL